MALGVSSCVICLSAASFITTPEQQPCSPRKRKRTENSCFTVILNKFLTELDHHHLQSIVKKEEGAGDNIGSPLKFESADFEDVAFCSQCRGIIRKAFDMREKAKEKEKVVYSLQRQLLKELRLLEGYLEGCGGNMRKLEEMVEKTNKKFVKRVTRETAGTRTRAKEERRNKLERVRDAILKGGPIFPSFRWSCEQSGDDEEHENKEGRSATASTTFTDGRLLDRNEWEAEDSNIEAGVIGAESAEWRHGEGLKVKVEVIEGPEDSEVNDCDTAVVPDTSPDLDDPGPGFAQSGRDKMTGSELSGGGDEDEWEGPKVKKYKKCVNKKLRDFLHKSGISLQGVSDLRKRFILDAVKQKMRSFGKAGKKEEDLSDDYWFVKKYIVEYTADQGFHVAGVGLILNEEAKRWECSKCEFRVSFDKPGQASCKSKHEMHRHILSRHLSHLEILKCRICKDEPKFRSLASYAAHMKLHRDREGPLLLPTCDICGRPFGDTGALVVHRFTHMSEEEREESKRNGTYRGKSEKKKEPDPADKQCPICQKQFKTRNYLKSHLKTHQDPKDPVQCEACGITLRKASYMKRHLKCCPARDTVPAIRIPCPQCDRTFKSSYILRYHLNTVHSEERPFQCEVCGMRFKTQPVYRNHMRLHNEKEFKCGRCGKAFPFNKYLTRHERKCSSSKPDASKSVDECMDIVGIGIVKKQAK